MKIEEMSFEQLHEHALSVQDACNLSGVVHSFSLVMTRLWKIANEYNKGTEWVNSNSVTRLFTSKIISLTGQTESSDWHPIRLKVI